MKDNIVILHGWQSKISRWQKFKQRLKKDFNVYLPHLPGFGKKKLASAFNLNDYCHWLKRYLINNRIKKPILIGHSFGGRIAINFSVEEKGVKKLILIASAGIKSKKNFKQFLGLILAKAGRLFFLFFPFSFLETIVKKLFYIFLIREKDYYQADKKLKETMKNIIKIDLKEKLKRIKVPTLICWGRKDRITPIRDAYSMAFKIPQSKLIIWEQAGHSLPFQKTGQLTDSIINFCKNEVF